MFLFSDGTNLFFKFLSGMSLKTGVFLHEPMYFIVLATRGYKHALRTFENENMKVHLFDVKTALTILEDAGVLYGRAVILLMLDVVFI